MIKRSLTLIAVFLLLLFFQVKGQVIQIHPDLLAGRALSMRVLQEKLRLSKKRKSYPKEVFELAKINRILGFVIDKENKDVILIGQVVNSIPPIHVEDLSVALRNAWLKYTKRKGNTIIYSSPGCSIDPSPKVFNKLDQISNQLNKKSSQQDIKQWLERWDEICHQPQGVRVMGIPFNTHFASVMVKADYDLKLIADGKDSLGVPGLISLMKMKVQAAKRALKTGQPLSFPLASLDRFWFYPGEYSFIGDENGALFNRCTVKLLNERQYLNKRGQIVGTGQSNPMSLKFVHQFTNKYDEISKKRPIYAELENLFRLVAFAKALKLKYPNAATEFDLSSLIDEFSVPRVVVQESLPGRSNVEYLNHRTEVKRGYNISHLWLPSCGGVTIDYYIKPVHFHKYDLSRFHQRALKYRPSPLTLYWDFPEAAKVEIIILSKIKKG